MEQTDSDQLLQLIDGNGKSGLRQEQLLRSTSKAALTGDLDKCPDMPQG